MGIVIANGRGKLGRDSYYNITHETMQKNIKQLLKRETEKTMLIKHA